MWRAYKFQSLNSALISRAIIQTSSLSLLYVCPHTTTYLSIYLSIHLSIYKHICIEIYWDILRYGWSMGRVSVALPWKTGATSLCLNLPPKLELESSTTNKKVQIRNVCVCVWNRTLESRERGRQGFKRKKDKEKKMIYTHTWTRYTHTHTHTWHKNI
jgi:hypothetical protein